MEYFNENCFYVLMKEKGIDLYYIVLCQTGIPAGRGFIYVQPARGIYKQETDIGCRN